MGLHVEMRGGVAIMVPDGPLDGGRLTKDLDAAMRRWVEKGQKKILLDLGRIPRKSMSPVVVDRPSPENFRMEPGPVPILGRPCLWSTLHQPTVEAGSSEGWPIRSGVEPWFRMKREGA